MKRTQFTLTPIAPFDFDLTASHVTYFQDQYGADRFHEGVYSRLLDLGDCLCLVEVRSTGGVDSPRLKVKLKGPALDETTVSTLRSLVARLFGIDKDLEPFYRTAVQDPALKSLVAALRGLHVPQTLTLWEALVLAILGQQVSSQVAHRLRTLLVQAYGLALEDSGVIYYSFPSTESILAAGFEGLRSVKLSKRKAEYIFDIAASLVSGELDLEGLRILPDEEVVQNLRAIRGIGPWTAQWLLIRGLDRADAFPQGDLALRRIMARLFKHDSLLDHEVALKYSRRWSPFRSYVTTYLFAAMRSGRFSELF